MISDTARRAATEWAAMLRAGGDVERVLGEWLRMVDTLAAERDAQASRVRALEAAYETSHRSRLHAEDRLSAAEARVRELEAALRNLLESLPHHEGDDNLTEPILKAEMALGSQ